jgi:hypothetical protein
LLSVGGGGESIGKIQNAVNKPVDFIICPLCFWCATYFDIGRLSNIKCPLCQNNHIDQLPLSIDKV